MMLGYRRLYENQTACLVHLKNQLYQKDQELDQQPEATAQNIPCLTPSRYEYELENLEDLQNRRFDVLTMLHQCQVEQVQINFESTLVIL